MKLKIALCSAIITIFAVSPALAADNCTSSRAYLYQRCQQSLPLDKPQKTDTSNYTETVAIVPDGRFYQYRAGQGIYQVHYNYTGRNWTHADVAPIHIDTDKPIAILPIQYTANNLQPGASVNGVPIGQYWNTVTVLEMKQRLEALGFFVLTPTIQMYGESLNGFQALEHFIAGVHKGNSHVQTIILTADANVPNEANPRPGAQMLVTGLHPRDLWWEYRIQSRIMPFYQQQGLYNIGPRVRGGKSNKEGHSLAWHPLIERAAEYNPNVAIIEVAQAVEIVQKAGSIQAGQQWAAPLFDAIAFAMAEHACANGANLQNLCQNGILISDQLTVISDQFSR
ncbi:MAG: hypothetical protein VKK42_15555 [Lyngbya sp.]|nr:hypothetical protein [Lyngbya sp.]